jgi:hypothetical protein
MTRSRVMRGAAPVLAAVILPLAVFAAVSMGQRLNQYGLAPERLWGLVAIVVACVCGVAYWVALVRGRKGGWAGHLRQATFHIALVVCGLAILLALPILNFGAISARNQMARLESGAVTPDEFDFVALRWDFGDAGKRALRRLERSGNPDVAKLARGALGQTERPYVYYGESAPSERDFKLKVQPDDPALHALVLEYLRRNPWQCDEHCVALDLGPGEAGARRVAIVRSGAYQIIQLLPERPGTFVSDGIPPASPLTEESTVEIRDVRRRFIFIDGKPVGPPLDETSTPLEASPSPR